MRHSRHHFKIRDIEKHIITQKNYIGMILMVPGSQNEINFQNWPIGSKVMNLTKFHKNFQCCALGCLLFLPISFVTTQTNLMGPIKYCLITALSIFIGKKALDNFVIGQST